MFKKFNWGHGIVLALGSFIAFILFMVLIFPSGQQNAEMVTDDYYSEELNFQQVIDAKKNAESLNDLPTYKQLASGIQIDFPATIIPDDSQVHFDMYRTNDSNLDVKKDLVLDENNSFTIPRQVISVGSYTLKVKWKENKKPYQIDYDVLWK